jgi:polyisoprenoid-binding protein YceI
VKRIAFLSLTALSLMMSDEAAKAQQHHASVTRIAVRSDSRLWLEGTSNVRDWTCRATSLDATIEVNNADTTGHMPSEVVKGVTVKVPVRMLKCGDRHMEAHMYTALKSSDAAPGFITAEVDQIPQSVVTGQRIETEARLTIAGVQRTVKMTVTSELLADGTRRARGTVPILMTDFGITPPRPWGGILRTADQVLIQFEIFVPARA